MGSILASAGNAMVRVAHDGAGGHPPTDTAVGTATSAHVPFPVLVVAWSS